MSQPGSPTDKPVARALRAVTGWVGGHDVLGRSFTVMVGLRGLLAAHAVGYNLVVILPNARQPVALVAATLVLVGWTGFISWHLRWPSNRTAGACIADVGVSLAMLILTPFVVDPAVAPLTVAGLWFGSCALFMAVFVSTGWAGAAALGLGVVFLALPPGLTLQRVDIAMAGVLGPMVVGLLIGQFKSSISDRDRERTRAGALAERERLARLVHDGTLQVLALVAREGAGLGPRGARLATLAHESESQLRSLLHDREVPEHADSTLVDLAIILERYASARVTVSTMAGAVMIPRRMADEVAATLEEALTNVERHAGDQAQAWVLLDQETDDEVIVWVRDNGVGMAPAQIAEAASRGRMGIQHSIVGRMTALGGSAMLKSTPGSGTEWELRFALDVEE
ncbi:MAG: ATP-binding protein [Arachnia sp.]